MFHLFLTYVVTNASCYKYSMNRHGKWTQAEVVPMGESKVHAGSEASVAAPTCMRSNRRGRTGRRSNNNARRQQLQQRADRSCMHTHERQPEWTSGGSVRPDARASSAHDCWDLRNMQLDPPTLSMTRQSCVVAKSRTRPWVSTMGYYFTFIEVNCYYYN